MQHIPSVNLHDFLSNDPAQKQHFVSQIGAAFEQIGFVALKGHFLDPALIDDLYTQTKLFFDLPLDQKKSYEIPGIAGQRGYVSFGKEHAKGKKEGDLKEFWHFGQYLKPNSAYASKYPDNVTVHQLPHFNNTGQKAFQMLEKTGIYVLRALAIYLELDEFYFDNFVQEGNSILRPIHYPPIIHEPQNATRAAAHADINLITLLMGAQGRGLQVQSHDQEWVDAIAQDDELIINVGDMLSRHTNNTLKSTIHQVVNPPRELWGSSRYSIPFFMHPVSDMSLNCIENCIDKNHPKLYEDTTAGEFLHERLIELGLIKK